MDKQNGKQDRETMGATMASGAIVCCPPAFGLFNVAIPLAVVRMARKDSGAFLAFGMALAGGLLAQPIGTAVAVATAPLWVIPTVAEVIGERSRVDGASGTDTKTFDTTPVRASTWEVLASIIP